ncbi:hypothetical protein M427DRAFT_68199 [Gonapodya prolifera JEL478]|uniref:SH3 domain-containing protein n=1 Tax=Gonapodya prolifera (strain JEL478) TaxID=1344416 RepID=A0A139ALN9_GONPJ|nr:hypothetical protein M427DRAFT_68199 [Gonapodya prolifera JEL478]|eukprot:KXS17669.1 hypothetical protein M427DRAFT_68199 [Gonapodya prolifera JEL478]
MIDGSCKGDYYDWIKGIALNLVGGKFIISKPGGEVNINSPQKGTDVYIEVNHQPRLDMVATLHSQLTKATTRIAALERTVALLQQSGSASHQGQAQTLLPPIDVKKVMHVVADYAPIQGDEIELAVGQVVFCNLQYHDGWCQGMNTITRASGYFPMSQVSSNPTPSPSAPPFTTRMDSIKCRGAPPSPPLSQRAVYTQFQPSGSYRRQTPPSTRNVANPTHTTLDASTSTPTRRNHSSPRRMARDGWCTSSQGRPERPCWTQEDRSRRWKEGSKGGIGAREEATARGEGSPGLRAHLSPLYTLSSHPL